MERQLKENEVLIGDGEGKIYEIKPVKMKYMKKGYYGVYTTVNRYNFVELMQCGDGEAITMDLLTGAFDSEEMATEVYEFLDVPTMKKIMSMIKKINELEDEIVPNVETPKE
jgi:hypothetical protein